MGRAKRGPLRNAGSFREHRMSQPSGAVHHPRVRPSLQIPKGGRGEYAKYGKGARHQWFARTSIAPEQQLTETEQQIACKKARRGLARASCAALDDDPLYTNHVTLSTYVELQNF